MQKQNPRTNTTGNYADLGPVDKPERLLADFVQLAVADAELDDLLADGFDLEVIEAPVIDADVLVAKSEPVKLRFRFGGARRRLGIREVSMRIQNVQLLELLHPSQHAVERSPKEYSQLHVPCTTNIITMRFVFQNSNRVSAGFPLILKDKITAFPKGFAGFAALKYLLPPLLDGRVAERLKAPDSKSGVGVTLPGVQIPPLPPPFCYFFPRKQLYCDLVLGRGNPLSNGFNHVPFFILVHWGGVWRSVERASWTI